LTCKTVSRVTYTVLVETLNTAQSMLMIVGTTSLIAACSSKADSELTLLTCVDKLLSAGADPNATDQ